MLCDRYRLLGIKGYRKNSFYNNMTCQTHPRLLITDDYVVIVVVVIEIAAVASKVVNDLNENAL